MPSCKEFATGQWVILLRLYQTACAVTYHYIVYFRMFSVLGEIGFFYFGNESGVNVWVVGFETEDGGVAAGFWFCVAYIETDAVYMATGFRCCVVYIEADAVYLAFGFRIAAE